LLCSGDLCTNIDDDSSPSKIIDASSDGPGSEVTAPNGDAETTSGEESAAKGDETEAWRRLGLREIKKAAKRELRCALQSYGQVQQFFLHTPCDSLDQLLFALEDRHRNTIVVSVVWVRMASEDAASQLKTLEDTYGTGDVTPIATQVLALGGILNDVTKVAVVLPPP
jgi:hypothetical protein